MLERLSTRQCLRHLPRLAAALGCCVLVATGAHQSPAQEPRRLREAKSPAALAAAPQTTSPRKDNAIIELASGDAPIKDETTEAALDVKHEQVTTQLRVAMLQEENARLTTDWSSFSYALAIFWVS